MSDQQPAPSGNHVDKNSNTGRTRILIVDDDQPMALGLKALVEKENHQADHHRAND